MSTEHIDWAAKYELGVSEIDLQHHYFIDLINRMVDELEHDDVDYQQRLISELNAYVKFHFISEENLMYKAGYPALEEHRNSHFNLIQELNSKQAAFAGSGGNATEITDFLHSWFVHHTIREDRKFADFLGPASDEKPSAP